VIELRPTTLQARGVRLEPLGHEHVAGLREAAQDGELWRLVYTSVPDPEGAEAYVAQALAGQAAGHMLPWAVLDAGTGEVLGSTRYHDVVAEADRVEIGYTWYRASRQRTHVNTACKRLLLDYAFEVLGCGVVGLRTDVLNARSQRAIEALGATKDGLLRHHRLRRDGSVRDTVLYSILRAAWPGVRERLEARLARHETPED
jgi:RimJ/RimL family protein N-acetyltransferase